MQRKRVPTFWCESQERDTRMYETDLRKCIYKRVTYWGITSIEIIIEIKIENKKFPGLKGCSGFRLEPWRKTTT